MGLSDHPVTATIAVSDITRAAEFYEGALGLQVVRRGPSAAIVDGSRTYRAGAGSVLEVYQSDMAGQSSATLATWHVDDIDGVVQELSANGVELARYEGFETDANGIGPRAGGGRIAWFQDPDGNTFAIETDD